MAGSIGITKATPPVIATHVAALATQAKAQPHVQAALLGVGPMRLATRYILPAMFDHVLRHATWGLPGIALVLAAFVLLVFLAVSLSKLESRR